MRLRKGVAAYIPYGTAVSGSCRWREIRHLCVAPESGSCHDSASSAGPPLSGVSVGRTYVIARCFVAPPVTTPPLRAAARPLGSRACPRERPANCAQRSRLARGRPQRDVARAMRAWAA